MEKQRPKSAVNVFVIRDGKILLGKRKGVGDGFWGLPGGHLEMFESYGDCARRELMEETGLRADKMTFLHTINDPRPNEDQSHYIHTEFLAEGVIGEPELKEPDRCYEWRWFDLNELPENMFIGHRKSVPAYLQKIMIIDVDTPLKYNC